VTNTTELSFEAALKQLEEVVQRLERGEPTLEESLQLYEQGIRLSRLCQQKLEEAQGKVEMLLKDDEGEPRVDAKGRPKTVPIDAPDEGRP
jgi:exodeoxyribonuclease VII small subunit